MSRRFSRLLGDEEEPSFSDELDNQCSLSFKQVWFKKKEKW